MSRLSHDRAPRQGKQAAWIRRLSGRYQGVLGGDRVAIVDQRAWRAFWEAWAQVARPIRLRAMLGIGERELSEWRRGKRIVVAAETLNRLNVGLRETAETLDTSHPGRGLVWLRSQQRRLSEAADRQVITRLREWRRALRGAGPDGQAAAAPLEELIRWDPPARALTAADLQVWRRVTARELGRLRARVDRSRLLVLELLGEGGETEAWVVNRPLPSRIAQLGPAILASQQSWNEDSQWRRKIRAVLSRAMVVGHDGMVRALEEARALGIDPGAAAAHGTGISDTE